MTPVAIFLQLAGAYVAGVIILFFALGNGGNSALQIGLILITWGALLWQLHLLRIAVAALSARLRAIETGLRQYGAAIDEIQRSVWECRNHLGSEGASRERPR